MGRWHRRKNNQSPAQPCNEDVWLYQPARRDLVGYLERYCAATIAFAHSQGDEDLAPPEVPAVKNNTKGGAIDDNEPMVICGVEFPAIRVVCRQPYFAVPELTNKQRKVVHECCQEADLFHTTFNGCFYISLFADGFEHIKGWKPPRLIHSAPPMYLYKPWFYQQPPESLPENGNLTPQRSNTNGSKSPPQPKPTAQSEADTAILRFIDHPGDCLREDRDTLIYATLHGADLNTLSTDARIDTTWELVETPGQLREAARAIGASREVAFDVESYGFGKYTQITCLLQFATDTGKEYIVDVLADGVWDAVHTYLAPIFADPAIVKIGHSMSGLDVRSLHRDFGCFVYNAFDTHQAARVLEMPAQGLASVCAHYGLQTSHEFVRLKDDHQRGDWRRRPLSESQLEYARCDVRYLLRLRLLMMRDLVVAEFWGRSAAVLMQERLAAAAWKESLLRFELAEDGMLEEEEEEGKSSSPLEKDALGVWTPDAQDDAATFKTSNDGMNTSTDEDLLFLTPTNSQGNFFASDDDDDDDDDEDMKADITVPQLRLQPLLMRSLWLSQESCRDFWTPVVEPHLKNEVFVNLQKRFRKNEITWLPSNTRLYEDLVQWRDQLAAHEMHCLPSFLVPLDFLALVAWKRPTTEVRLRRIRYELPDFLERDEKYRKEILDIVLRNAIETGSALVNDVYFYSDVRNGMLQSRRWWERTTMSWGDYETLAFRLAVAGILCGALVGALFEGKRRARR